MYSYISLSTSLGRPRGLQAGLRGAAGAALHPRLLL